jgi:ubiquinone/menaquinone biosynthesis C-methylase UbiE
MVSVYDQIPDFGLLYDAVPAYASRTDVAFYVDAASAGGAASRVLEIGSGTGRVTLPLARAGHQVVGVDASPSMLARARAKLAQEPPAVRERVTLIEADGRDFDAPGAPFDLAIAPFRVLQHFTTPSDQLAVLGSVRRHLDIGGRLAFDVFNPSYSALVGDRTGEAEDTPEQLLPDGRAFRRTVRIPRVRFVEQVSDVELIYYVRSGAETTRYVQAFPMRWYTPSELEHLVARAGFTIESMRGGFDGRPLTDDAPEIVIVARAREAAASLA